MQADQFNRIVKEQVMHCLDLLSVKAGEYATADRLQNCSRDPGVHTGSSTWRYDG